MTPKEWLNRGYRLDAEINQLEQAKRNMLDTITNTTPNYGGEVVSGTRNPHKYDAYVEYCEKIDRRIDALYAIKEEIQDAIAMVSDNTQRIVLISRYINFYTWEQIAVKLNYSRQGVLKIHTSALKSIDEIFIRNCKILNEIAK